MLRIRSLHPASAIFFLAFLILGVASFAFVWHEVIAGFEDDSVSYIILSQWMSPWFSTPDVIAQAARYETYPPLFPLLLALTGASHHMLAAHILVVLLHLTAVCLMFRLSAVILKDHWSALIATLVFAISPSVWMNLLGILSENLYLVISLLTLLVFQKLQENSSRFSVLNTLSLALLFTLLVTTRSIGITMIGAYGLWTLFRYRSIGAVLRPACLLPCMIPVVIALAWSYLRPSIGSGQYEADVVKSLSEFSLMPQLSAIGQSWLKAFAIFWTDGTVALIAAATFMGLFALVGIGNRLANNRLDAWYSLLYLGLLSVWPHPDQVDRFLHALLPVLIIQSMAGLGFVFGRMTPEIDRKVVNIMSLVFLIIVLPTLVFFMQRANYETQYSGMDFSRVPSFYRFPDLPRAEFRALRNEQLRADFEKVRQSTPEDAVIMWYTPKYIRLYSLRQAIKFPDFSDKKVLAESIRDSGADYIFLADLHPRNTHESFNGLSALPYVEPFTAPVWTTRFLESERVASMLLKVDFGKPKKPGLE